MSPAEARTRRLINHGLAHRVGGQPAEVVTWFGAMQAQDPVSARWALGVRCDGLTDAKVEQAIADRSIVRTWALRNTLHLVAAADVHWLIALIGPVMLARNAARYRGHGLDTVSFRKVEEHIHDLLQGGKELIREELFAALEQRGIDTQGMRGSGILYRAALSGCLCPASSRGKQTTYALLDEWVPEKNRLDRDAALAELTRRYFRSHGPATLRDFAWWSGLPLADARRGISMAEQFLREVRIQDQPCWQSLETVSMEAGVPVAHLLPAFDEFFLGYEDRSIALEATHFEHVMTNNGIFRPTILIDGEIVGIWGRIIKKGAAILTRQLFRALTKEEVKSVNLAAQRYAEYLGLRCQGFASEPC